MKESINVWGIKEHEGDGRSCPIIPANLPFHKKLVLFFFRFGVCPACITMSLVYNLANVWKLFRQRKPIGKRISHTILDNSDTLHISHENAKVPCRHIE